MFRSLAVATALVLAATPVLAAPQTDAELAERDAAARRLLAPIVAQLSDQMIAPIWEETAKMPVSDVERAALRVAFDRERTLVNQDAGDFMVRIIIKHVPVSQLQPGDPMSSPQWMAAGAELDSHSDWAKARGVEMMARVIEQGCAAEATPSAACVNALNVVSDYRSGRVTVAEIVAED